MTTSTAVRRCSRSDWKTWIATSAGIEARVLPLEEARYLVVAGPTAVGKTAVALEVADELDGEIVIADSRQVYRGLEIGTAKPTADERSRVPHHMLDVVDLGQRYTAADFAAQAGETIDAIRSRGRVPVVCGGTGLYLAALAGSLDPVEEGAGEPEREEARARVAAIPATERHAALARVDEPSATRLHAADRQRVDRALEVWFLTGEPLSRLQSGGGAARPHLAIRLDRPRVELAADRPAPGRHARCRPRGRGARSLGGRLDPGGSGDRHDRLPGMVAALRGRPRARRDDRSHPHGHAPVRQAADDVVSQSGPLRGGAGGRGA